MDEAINEELKSVSRRGETGCGEDNGPTPPKNEFSDEDDRLVMNCTLFSLFACENGLRYSSSSKFNNSCKHNENTCRLVPKQD